MTQREVKALMCVIALGAMASAAHGQDEAAAALPADITDVSINDLLDSKVTVADREGDNLREASGIVSVITRNEIIDSGARDLIDVLMQVPGFSFGADIEGSVSIAFHGTWSIDGKVLLLIDGQEMNERLYADLLLGHHYPVDQIERIEIIRGPGSAIYGGFAELAVINVITRSATQLQGIEARITYGRSAHTFMRHDLSFAYGQKLENGLEITASGLVGQGHRTGSDFTDIYGTTTPQLSNRLDPRFLNLGATYKGAKLRVILDDYRTTAKDGYDAILPAAYHVDFFSAVADLQYDWKVNDKLKITPRITYRRDTPWQATETSPYYFDISADHYLANALATADLGHDLSLVAGGEGFIDKATVNDPTNANFDPNTIPGGGTTLSFYDVAAIAQLTWKSKYANVIAGAREEYHSKHGSSFVPRLGITRVIDKFHFKALFSRAFRAPALANYFYQTPAGLSPERTTVVQGEVGYQPDEHTFVVANAYYQKLTDALIYFYDATTTMEGYDNFASTGTRGIELDVRARYPRWNGSINYSFYTTGGGNDVVDWAVPGHDNVLLGQPQHKVALNASVAPFAKLPLRVGPSASLISTRYAYDHLDAMDNPVIIQLEPLLLANVYVEWQDAFTKDLDIGLGAYNIFGANYYVPQSYNGFKAPLPALDTEVLLRVTYGLRLP